MKRIISAFLALFGVSAAAHGAAPVQTIDLKSIQFTMPTVAADELQFVIPTKESFEGAPQFHEDEWCQLEFFPRNRLSEIQGLLAEYKAFEQKHRTKGGWSDIYVRRIARKPVVEGADAERVLAEAVHANVLPAPILGTTSRPLGQVKDGFTLQLPGSELLYGVRTGEGAASLGAIVGRGGDDSQLTKAFITLANKQSLILVDWRAQQLLVSVNENGQINAWRP